MRWLGLPNPGVIPSQLELDFRMRQKAQPLTSLLRDGDLPVGHQNAACKRRQAVARGINRPADAVQLYKIGLMVTAARPVIGYARAWFVPRHKLALEAAALRQQ
jgi:hypothetical protein